MMKFIFEQKQPGAGRRALVTVPDHRVVFGFIRFLSVIPV